MGTYLYYIPSVFYCCSFILLLVCLRLFSFGKYIIIIVIIVTITFGEHIINTDYMLNLPIIISKFHADWPHVSNRSLAKVFCESNSWPISTPNFRCLTPMIQSLSHSNRKLKIIFTWPPCCCFRLKNRKSWTFQRSITIHHFRTLITVTTISQVCMHTTLLLQFAAN